MGFKNDLGTRSKCLLAVPILVLWSAIGGTAKAQSVVKVTGTQGNWQLTLNGQPYYIKGLDYGPDLKTTQSTTNAYVADLVATGANTTRTWGTGSTTSNLLAAVDLYNAHVVMGFWLNQNVNYCTAANLNTTLNQIVNWVNSYKNDPGVLIWDIGNEVILQAQNYFSGTTLENDRVCYAQFVNQISQAIHAADPNHPTTSTDAWTGAWPYYAQYSPDLDLLAVNSYGGVCTVESAWSSGPNNNGVPYTKPYIVTEFGPSGEWEVPNDSNGVPLEPTDLEKAAAYPNAWACITGSNGNGAAGVSLGATAFIYGNKNDFGGVWFNDEYTTSMTKRLSYYSQFKMYTGVASTANQPPACQSMTLSQTSHIAPGSTFTVTTDFVDPENDPMTFNLMINEKYINGSTSLTNATFTQTGPQTFTVTAPTTAGVWKLYVYAFDGHNNVGIQSASFAVQ
ncbi:MAG: coagulation factor 5/8 type domain protein [Acidobacteria bacterium]|nr:MAG: coagulation factor 5/8 type domain protein [Acidobacteriota bacterium]